GDAALVARYRAQPALAPALVPAAAAADRSRAAAGNFIDDHVFDKLARRRSRPADRSDDATFLPRSPLVVSGVRPAPGRLRPLSPLARTCPRRTTLGGRWRSPRRGTPPGSRSHGCARPPRPRRGHPGTWTSSPGSTTAGPAPPARPRRTAAASTSGSVSAWPK